MKITQKVVLPVIAVNVILLFFIFIFTSYSVSNTIQSYFTTVLKENSKIANSHIESLKSRSLNSAKWFENSAELVTAVKENNRDKILKVGKAAMESFELGYFVVTDKMGNVLVRAHEPEKFGDSISKQVNIQKALQGEVSVGIEEGAVVKMSIRAGSPLKDEQGNIVGAISAGYVFGDESFTDGLKGILNTDLLVYSGDELTMSTFIENKTRFVGEKLSQELHNIMYEKKQMYTSTESLLGEKHLMLYTPIVSVKNEVLGVLAITEKLTVADTIIKQVTLLQTGAYIVSSLIIILMLTFMLRKFILKHIKVLVAFFNELAHGEGDLTRKIEVNTKDEIAEMVGGFNKFIKKLNEIITNVKNTSQNLVSSTNTVTSDIEISSKAITQISSNVDIISENMHQNVATIEETTASSQELASSADMVASSCGDMLQESIKSIEAAKKGVQVIDQIVESIEGISNSSNDVVKNINELKRLSIDIAGIVNIISDISTQTNLLALNASIEAARAGEQGKGFAVVAEEIRQLADDSGKSTKSIALLIKEVEEKIGSTVTLVEQVADRIEDGATTTSAVKDVIGEIVDSINIVEVKAQNITSASEEQAAAVSQIAIAMDNMARVVSDTSSNTTEISLSMNKQTDIMHQIESIMYEINCINASLSEQVNSFKTES